MISVIIPAYDKQELTIAHIKKCMESSVMPGEIIVVNDGDDPKLLDMIKDIEKIKCPIKYARVTEDIPWNQCGARNLGIFISKGDYLSIEDNDHIPSETYYEEAVNLLKENDRIIPRTRQIVNMEDILKGIFKPTSTRGKTDLTCIITRELAIKLKGYEEKFCGRYGWEAPDWINRINRVGAKTICNGVMYMVIDGLVEKIERPHDGKNFKMERENSWELRRNNKAERKQSTKGIINFNYDYEEIHTNI